MDNAKSKLMAAVRRMRQSLCAYFATGTHDDDLHFCDCKFGADRIGQHSEQGSGCPELRLLHDILDGLTAKQIQDAAAKGIKKRERRIGKKRRAVKR